MSDEVKADFDIKKRLRYTWQPFFSPFSRLLEVQRQTIPFILEQRNLVISSPAATGKTEAVIAPIIERMIEGNWQGLSVLYISPTRALVNDLYRRIKNPLDYLDITVTRKTMDRPEFNPKRPSSVLITTPESFDSLLSRHPEVFESLKVVCLDELHLLDNTVRGDQLRLLLQRLRLIMGSENINFYALSATIADPYAMGRRYFNNFYVVVVRTEREIDYRLLEFKNDVSELLFECRKMGLHKLLVFCNTRKQTEDIALLFKRTWSYPHRVFVHHASLSKKERESAEQAMNRERVGICVATMTLELGIDIGDIDAVVLFSPPFSVTSLLQRLGRGNRRTNRLIAFGLYTSEWDKILFRVIFELAKIGWIEGESYSPKISVAVQQILSYTHQKQRVGVTLDSISRVVEPLGLTRESVRTIIEHLIDKRYLRVGPHEIIRGNENMAKLVERGHIHSNIDDKWRQYEVVDVVTGKSIGKVEGLAPSFALKGRFWAVKKIVRRTAFVRQIAKVSPVGKKIFRGKGRGLWDFRLGAELKKALFQGVKENELPYFEKDNKTFVFHFMGLIYGYLWAEILSRRRKLEAGDVGGIYLLVNKSYKPEDLINITEGEVINTLDEVGSAISRFLNLGSFFQLLPKELKLEAIHSAVNADKMLTLLHNFIPKNIASFGLSQTYNA